ncbi:alpha/beta fold hydrolase [Luteibacter rhizovicinus]|uniref:alpha/beta fold hydrolase n=1 Tax=Luteibacter rhizovicinus TaxID=242606 RepID=UPI00062D44A7|nr:alpha/beta fold hydrolase [Luteibacter rhizovicinus]KLD76422.1 hypothetical protein Y886_21460 [Xanthomonas hyacinthi DSM 19077]
MPRDYAQPEAATLDLDVVRVVAASERGNRHDGVVLLEPDEFAEPAIVAVPAMASTWLDGDGYWREAARRLDLVGLAQRRMDDAGGRDCLSATSHLPRHDSLGTDGTLGNMTTAGNLALAIATACQNDTMHAHIGVGPRIEDMERLREALGQPAIHLIGIGRGGWVASRYAERYPRHVGRMLLDSSWDADGSVAEAMEARVEERGRTIRRAVAALIADPARYHGGDDVAAIHRRLGRLPPLAYATWTRHIVDADDLAAVLVLGTLSARHATMSTPVLRNALVSAERVVDIDVDVPIRRSAGWMLDRLDADRSGDPYGFGPRASNASPALTASVFATRCNDGSWGSDRSYWRTRTRDLRATWPSAVGNESFQGMVCSEWPTAFAPSSVPDLVGAPPFLMVHAEFDDEAPLRPAAMMLQGHANASMVVARNLRAHGVLARRDRACVSELAGRFLVDGTLPAAKLSNCRLPLQPTMP